MNKNSDSFVSHGLGGSASSWLDLVNSELSDGYGNFTDLLENRDWVYSFLKYWDFRVSLESFPQQKFKTLRAQLRQLVAKAASGERLGSKQLEHLNGWLKVWFHVRVSEDQNGLHRDLIPVRSGWPVILANLASAFVDTLIAYEPSRLRICQNEDCRWVFIDKTRGNVRRWCSNATCGNRARVRKARAGAEMRIEKDRRKPHT
jgi:predicted RNA-binding Zn ribbon-like protein